MTLTGKELKADLIALLEEKGLDTKGTKDDLIARYNDALELKEDAENIVDEIDDKVDEALDTLEDLTEGTKLGKYIAWLNDRPQVKRGLLLAVVALALATGLYSTTL